MYNFFKKVIVVTGGKSGNGESIVKNFLSNNAKVYSLDYKFDRCIRNNVKNV